MVVHVPPNRRAAQKGEDGIVALLTKREADLDVVDGDLQTPLVRTCLSLELLSLPSSTTHTQSASSPLSVCCQHWAIDKGHKAIARHLIEHGAALDIQDKFGHSGIHPPIHHVSTLFSVWFVLFVLTTPTRGEKNSAA
jgi:ankyrin repeat protein